LAKTYAEKIWNKLTRDNFVIDLLCVASSHRKMTPIFIARFWLGVAFAAWRVVVRETEVVKCMAQCERLSVTVECREVIGHCLNIRRMLCVP